jgi:ABC-type thiamin/hydroxymethylpyrimidine transport system permease subunit
MNSMPKSRAIKHLVTFLVFGPMLGLMIFIVYITREQTIPMILCAAAGVGIGKAIQYLIFLGKKVFSSRNLLINVTSWFSVGIICSLLGYNFYGLKFLLYSCVIALLGILYAIYFKYFCQQPSA